ncbi:MAG: hypothetical protein LBL74_04845 [Bacteroidales bacterium]|jgi:hypothetical protein|nr:hypothetical protein [Bacteroidales bacterium]
MPKISRRKLNYLKKSKEIRAITLMYYKPHFTTLAGVWRKYIKNKYFIEYQQYLNILNETNLTERIELLEKQIEERDGRQLRIFDD